MTMKQAIKDDGPFTAEVMAAVWEAEDGRCENCGRAMGLRAACFARVNQEPPADYSADNLRLLCVDCKHRWSSPFALGLAFGPDVEVENEVAALVKVGDGLLRYGVIVWRGKLRRRWWLPGVGSFLVEHSRTVPAVILQVSNFNPEGEIIVKPQARTRGLPRGVR